MSFLFGCAMTPMQQTIISAPPLQAVAANGTLVSAENSYVPADTVPYRLSVGDTVNVRYLRRPDFNTQVSVTPDGLITLPFISSVVAAGLTVDELRETLYQRYSEIFARLPAPIKKRYLIGTGDALEIKFPYNTELSGTVIVRPDGRVSFPLIQTVVAEGKTPENLERELIEVYKNHIPNVVLVLNVHESASSEILANGSRTLVPPRGIDEIYVTINETTIQKVYVGGEVVNSTAIEFTPNLSSLQAIISVGGATPRGSLKHVIILRKGSGVTPQYIVLNLQSDISNSIPAQSRFFEPTATEAPQPKPTTNDIRLQPFDVVIVPRTGIAAVKDALDHYLYDLLPPLRNSSVGFNWMKTVGTQKVDQNTTVAP